MKIIDMESPNVLLIQKAVQAALILGKHPKDLHNRIIPIYWNNYKVTGDHIHLKFALEHITAYVKSNFDYSDNISLFTEIVKEAGHHSFEDFLIHIHATKQMRLVKLTRNRIYSILGDGMFTIGNRSIATKDIMKKIKNRERGVYPYTIYLFGVKRTAFLWIDDYCASMHDADGIEYVFELPEKNE